MPRTTLHGQTCSLQHDTCALLHRVQVAPYDPRHSIQTICHLGRHNLPADAQIELYVWEENAEALARHMILWAILLDTSLLDTVRMQRFLEVLGNAFLRQDTADYLVSKCKQLEAALAAKFAGKADVGVLASLVGTDLLSFADRDALLAAITGASEGQTYDMAKAWDGRCRMWYADRYDFRRNMVRIGTLL